MRFAFNFFFSLSLSLPRILACENGMLSRKHTLQTLRIYALRKHDNEQRTSEKAYRIRIRIRTLMHGALAHVVCALYKHECVRICAQCDVKEAYIHTQTHTATTKNLKCEIFCTQGHTAEGKTGVLTHRLHRNIRYCCCQFCCCVAVGPPVLYGCIVSLTTQIAHRAANYTVYRIGIPYMHRICV